MSESGYFMDKASGLPMPYDPTPKLWRWCGECTKAHTVGLEGGHECQKG
jgi:hypothetical protein